MLTATLIAAGTTSATSLAQGVNPINNKSLIQPKDFFKDAEYSDKVKAQMSDQTDTYHAFSESVDAFAADGTVTPIQGADGKLYYRLDIPGAINGQPGTFEYIRGPGGIINHRLFKATY